MKTKLRLLFNSLLLLIVLVCSNRAYSQINFTESFVDYNYDWGFYFDSTDEDACDGNESLRFNLYEFETAAQAISPSIGTSNGGLITLTYDYKLINYDGGNATSNANNWGLIEIYYAVGEGDFVLLQTINPSNHVESASCATKTVTFSAPAGQSVYIGVYTEIDNLDNDFYVYLDNFHAVQAAPTACVGLPAAAAATTTRGIACNTESFTLGINPLPFATGLTYQWQWSTDGTTFANVPTGGTTASFTTTQTVAHWYRAAITCTSTGGGVTYSSPVQVFNTGVNCYCNDLVFDNGVEPITLVNFAGINNTSSRAVTSTPYIQDFTNTPAANVLAGQTYPITVKGNTNGNYINYFKVYIDFNHNGVLSDPGEGFELGSIQNSTGIDATQLAGNITIPGSALAGTTLMRVVKLYWYDDEDEPLPQYLLSPCAGEEHSDYGQAEDYLVTIQACTTPAPVAAATQTVCPGSTISNLVATGTALKWYAAATGGTALPTASALVNGFTYYVSQTGTCESTRTPVAVTINTPLADDPADVLSCGPYTLPALTNGTYRTATNGGGSVVLAGTVLPETTTLYVHAETTTTPACSVDNAFTVTITDGVVADNPDDVSACASYTLPELNANNVYRTATGGAGTVVAAGTPITETTTLYVYTSTTSTPVCSDENSFTVTIYNAVADDPADVVSCGEYILPALTNGTYHTAANGGGETLVAGDVVEDSTTLYVFAQAAGLETCTADNAFTVTVNYVEVDELDDVTECGEYILPEIENGTYYSGASGLGTMYEPGDAITETSTIHIFAQVGTGTTACTAESTFTVTILNATPLEREDVTACTEYILPDLPSGSVYFSGPNGQGESYPPGQPISASTTVYIQTATNGTIVCSAESSFEVTIVNVEALEDMTFTVVLAENGDTPTLADYDLEAEGDVVYYPNEQAAIEQTPVLSEDTEIPLGTTTYYVRHLQNGCYSEPSTVTFTVTLGTDSFDAASFSYYPNPVTDVLNVSYSQNINQISVYNLVGQLVFVKNVNNTSAQVDLGQLASGTYMVKVQTDNASRVVKVIKNR